jgi:hypothetical protein
VRTLIGNKLVKRLGKTFNGNLVGHGARGTEKPRLHAKHGGSFGFQFVHAFIFAKNIISNPCAKHSIEHAGGWFGNSVATQINSHHIFYKNALFVLLKFMKSILIILPLMLVFVSAKSQKWQSGHFVDGKGNRMDGLIQIDPSGKAPVKNEGFIAFKENKDAQEIKLSASELRYFIAGKDSFVVASSPMQGAWSKKEVDFVKVVLDEQLKLYAINGSGSGGGSGVHFSPGIGVGMGTGGYGYGGVGGGVGVSLGGGNGYGGRSKATYYFGAAPTELTMLTPQNFIDIMSDMMGDEPDAVEAIKSGKYNLGNIDKLITYFNKLKASHH